MSNFDTRFINFLTILLVLGLVSGLTACKENSQRSFTTAAKSESIIGGENVTDDSVFSTKVIYLALGVEKTNTPFGVNISQKGLCTAAAISSRILITAAHCVQNYKLTEVYAVLSNNPWNHNLDINEWIDVEKIVIHKDFNVQPDQLNNDLALIRLSKDLEPERISKLADAKQVVSVGTDLVTVGYGHTTALLKPEVSEATQMPSQKTLLNYAMKKIDKLSATDKIFSIDQSDKKGICQGDSGGPGFIYDSAQNEYFILGVASFVSMIESERPVRDPQGLYNNCIGRGNYTNLLEYKDWIAASLNELK